MTINDVAGITKKLEELGCKHISVVGGSHYDQRIEDIFAEIREVLGQTASVGCALDQVFDRR